jgi:hypothetical protein
MGLAPNHHLPLAAVHSHTIARHNPRFGSSANGVIWLLRLTVSRSVGCGPTPFSVQLLQRPHSPRAQVMIIVATRGQPIFPWALEMRRSPHWLALEARRINRDAHSVAAASLL